MKASLLALPLLGSVSLGCVIGLSNLSGVSLREQAQRDDAQPLELAPGETLTLDTSYGDAEVAAGAGAPEIRARLHASGRTRAEAEAVLARYELAIERGPRGPVVKLVGEPLHVHENGLNMQLAAHADFHATVPPGTALVATSGSGDLRARGALGACRLETDYGSIALEEARGDVRLKSGSGDVAADTVEGETIELESDYGSVGLGTARARKVHCRSGSGDVRAGFLTAETLELETEYGSVHVSEANGALRARSGSGDVRLHGVNGKVDAESEYGAVDVDGVLTELRADSGSGDVSARAREGSRLEKGWKLTSSYGRVTLRVPDDFACALDARTDYGSVVCDFPVTIEGGKRKGDGRLKGSVGGGGASVTLSSESGDVALKKL